MISKFPPQWNFKLTRAVHKGKMIWTFPPPWNFKLTWNVDSKVVPDGTSNWPGMFTRAAWWVVRSFKRWIVKLGGRIFDTWNLDWNLEFRSFMICLRGFAIPVSQFPPEFHNPVAEFHGLTSQFHKTKLKFDNTSFTVRPASLQSKLQVSQSKLHNPSSKFHIRSPSFTIRCWPNARKNIWGSDLYGRQEKHITWNSHGQLYVIYILLFFICMIAFVI